jgi:hypothetical protein
VDSGLTITLVVVVLVAIGGGVLWYKKGRSPKEEEFYHFRCSGCLRRLRYVARQVGHRGKCGHCQHVFHFPPISWSLEGQGKKHGTHYRPRPQ